MFTNAFVFVFVAWLIQCITLRKKSDKFEMFCIKIETIFLTIYFIKAEISSLNFTGESRF